ncbi:MMPL family transporter [Pseudalkalibacillus hwajinpoensis]|uniref:MMPL family transporter n=1 Tax=Guptibacillus hwajinpoensis TaxID=208199 RepID=A0A4U1MHP8_9BACL|nr:MMPL family transporter [Pseudalkalibacillus hwajinpoensis]TKD69962.1 MMPL family transporter [Pseudalkalibacillus hwajinpoensis]
MRQLLNYKWPIAIVLIAITIVLFFLSPNLSQQAENAGTFQLPASSDSKLAADILEEAGAGDETISVVFTYEDPIDEQTQKKISSIAKDIEQEDSSVTKVLDPFESDETAEQLVSEDNKTVLLPITVDGTNDEVNELANRIRQDVISEDTTAYVTGEAIINHDVNESAQNGLEKTELITVVLIFVLLFAVFRSITTPFIPLIAVGVTYLLSQSIVAFLIDWFGFPVSNYTQIFLVAILFGIGTDYCILLLSRYKEELMQGHNVEDAIVNTYNTAGRTLIISGLAVFIGFSAIGFAEFPIFKSAVGVAVGIAVLMVVLFTLVPFFMALLKDKLFWPSKTSISHKDSKLWSAFGRFSINKPILSMVIVAIIMVPLLFTYNDQLSFNTVNEIGQDYESVKGLDAIEEGFGKGDSLPIKVIIQQDKEIVTEEYLPYIETISKEIEKNKNVDSVRSITRPAGDIIDELYVDSQLSQVGDGLNEASNGINDVQDGLTEVQKGLQDFNGQIPSNENSGGLEETVNGLGQINDQLGSISQSLQQTQNINRASQQLGQVQQQLGQIQQGLSEASSEAGRASELSGGISQLSEGIGSSIDGLKEINNGLKDAADLVSEMGKSQALHDTSVFIPNGTLENKDFEPAIERYAFDKRKAVMLEVILEDDPYSTEAINSVQEIKDIVSRTMNGTPLEDATVAYSGVSSINNDLSDISTSDFTRTVIIMLVGLFVILTILFRSMIMPIVMIGSLLLTYYTSMAISELIFIDLMGYDGIVWAVPFFGFVMLIALGVDYSIFLLDRFKEEASIGVNEAMHHSMAKMGTVIITAAIILAGTFGAMMPSGVLSLMQIATIVITGLLLYGLIVLPLLIPAITVSFGKGIWWPFKQKQSNKS